MLSSHCFAIVNSNNAQGSMPMQNKYQLLCIVLLLCSNATPSWAETPANLDRKDAIELEGVVVTADRREATLKDTPEIIRVVTAEEIRQLNATSTGEILESVAGLTTESGTGSGYAKRSVVSINGLPPQYVLVLVNGQRLLTDHIHSGQNVDLIPPESITRIEIIKTAASAQYGSDAIGGVVNIITRKKVRGAEGKAYGSYGSKRSLNSGMGVVAPVGEGGQFSMFADWDRTDGPDILAPKHRKDKLGYSRISVLNNLDIKLAPYLGANIYFNYFQNSMEWAEDSVYSRLIMPKADFHLNLGKQWRITSTVEYTSWDSEQGSELNELLHPKLFATWTAFEGRNQLTFGGDYRHNWFRRTGLENTMTQWGYGVFAHDALRLNGAWSLSTSIRLDHFEELSPVFSPKAAILYRPIEEIGIRLAASRGFHAPTVQERYEKAYGHGGTALRFGNPDLEPETSSAFSLSVEGAPTKRLKLIANTYCHLVDNFIVPKYEGQWAEDPTKDMWVRTNILRAWLYGGELSGKWSPLPWLRLHSGYSYGTNWDEANDQQLKFHPGHSLFGKLDLRLRFATHYQVNLFVKALFRAGRSAWNWKPAEGAAPNNEEGNITELADYTLLDAGAEFAYKEYTAFINASNLLSEDIERLDDLLTKLDGTPLIRAGFRFEW
jgi:outer membrane receptor for ferrienterochelin and colicins